jgi:hypothetical protein
MVLVRLGANTWQPPSGQPRCTLPLPDPFFPTRYCPPPTQGAAVAAGWWLHPAAQLAGDPRALCGLEDGALGTKHSILPCMELVEA